MTSGPTIIESGQALKRGIDAISSKAYPLPMIDGDEYDGLTRWKQYLNWRAGERRKIKRGYNKRVRRTAKQLLRAAESVTGNGEEY